MSPETNCYPVRKSYLIFGIVVAGVLLASNIALALQNAKLARIAASHMRALEVPPGSHVPPLRGYGPDGQTVTIDYGAGDNRDTLLLVFSTTCGICDLNWPKWTSLIERADPGRLRIVLVDLSAAAKPEYLQKHHVERFPILTRADPKIILQYHFRLTPQTLLITPDSQVARVWTGELSRRDHTELTSKYAR